MNHPARLCHLVAVLPRASAAVLLLLCGCSALTSPTPTSPSVLGAPTVLSSEPWSFAGQPGRLIRTGFYRLYTTETDPYLLERAPLFLESALAHYRTALAALPEPPLKLDTFLMGNRDQWATLTRQVMGEDAETYLLIQRGGFSSGGRALLWTIGRHDTLSIAAHEGWHQYTQRTFRQWLPTWMEEGVATYMEGFLSDPIDPLRPVFAGWANVERFDQLRAAAARGGLMPLEELIDANPQQLIALSTDDTLTYYAQVWALTHFLREAEGGVYRRGLELMLLDAAQGRLGRVLSATGARQADPRSPLTHHGPETFAAYFAVDVATGVESAPGVKDHASMAAFASAAGLAAPQPPVAAQ